MILTVCWIVLWSMAICATGMLRMKSTMSPAVKVVLFPAVLVDSLIRAICCVLTITPLAEFRPLARGKMPFESGKSRLGPLGAGVASVLRLAILMLLTVYCVLQWLPAIAESKLMLPLIDQATLDNGAPAWHSLPTYWSTLVSGTRNLVSTEPSAAAVVVYFLCGLLWLSAPGPREWAWIIGANGLLVLASWVGQWLGVTVGFFSRGWFIRALHSDRLWAAFSFAVTLTVTLVLALLVVHAALVWAGVRKPRS